MQKNIQPLIYALLLAGGILGGYFLSALSGKQTTFQSSGPGKIDEVIQYAYDNYVDSIGYDALVDDAIAGMLEKLDPHSVYISKAELEGVNDQLSGSFEGIGVQFRIESDTIIVIDPIANGPSARQGVMPGDRIVKVDGKNVAGIGIDNDKVMKLLKGPKGTKVVLSIYRRGVKGLRDYTITRDVIPLNSLDAAFMIDRSTGYIKLNAFSSSTYDEFLDAMHKLLPQGMTNLILDLRDNGGGYLDYAVDIADDFLPSGNTIVYTQGLHRKEKFYKSHSDGLFESGKLVVLIDEFSASASEIVAGAIQDNDRGLIIGRRSFGKGLVQEQHELNDGSAFRLTVARYYTPSGRCIQRPYEAGYEEYYLDFYKSLTLNDSAAREYNLKKNDSLVFRTTKGRAVYGGGGIIPDSLVLHDYTMSASFQNGLFSSGKLFEFIFQYVDANRKLLKAAYPDIKTFSARFQVPADLMNKVYQSGGINPETTSAQDKLMGEAFVKAGIARELFGTEGYYQIILLQDNMVKKARQYFKAN
ncbi:hypothetical protein SDC9_64306 [bioreactor metagenome]|uniref:PDZ domain-containing protein n=1 Tax=bioreactor metagenome TaxID=1076179 RepID=A0A644XNY1_9ZZZZ